MTVIGIGDDTSAMLKLPGVHLWEKSIDHSQGTSEASQQTFHSV